MKRPFVPERPSIWPKGPCLARSGSSGTVAAFFSERPPAIASCGLCFFPPWQNTVQLDFQYSANLNTILYIVRAE